MSRLDYTVNVNQYLAKDTNHVDFKYAHIVMKDDPPAEEFDKVVMACPANRYQYTKDGKKAFYYAECLECGTCRILVEVTILKRWSFTHKDKGIEYQYG